jgi:hypothetical protein
MSLKRIPPNFWLRIRSGYRAGFAAFIIAAGLTGATITAISSTGTTFHPFTIVALGVLCVAIGLTVAYIRGRMKQLPDSFVDELSSDGQYTCQFCTTERLREACEMTKPYYGHEYVSPDVAEQWRMKNPRGFVEILNSEGELCACFGVLGLADGFMDQFVRGNVSDTKLRDDDILNFEDAKKSNRLYISGVVVRDPRSYKGNKRTRVMIWAMVYYIKKLYGLRRERELYTLPVNKESEALVKKFAFELVTPAGQRIDKCNMYRYTLSKESWFNLINSVGDHSPMCTCTF